MEFFKSIEPLLYIISAALMIVGLKGLTHPRTAVRGNKLAAIGMLLATITAVVHVSMQKGAAEASTMNWVAIIVGLALGGGVGWFFAVKVAMTDMPQMVALFNGFGGAASALVAALQVGEDMTSVRFAKIREALSEVPENAPAAMTKMLDQRVADVESAYLITAIAIAASGLIGAVTLTGSLVAFAKLQGIKWVPDKPLPGGQPLNILLLAGALVFALWMIFSPISALWAFFILLPIALVLGVGLVVPIGGADMPVVISLLNSYSGLAAAATGFVLKDPLLIVAGSLVGASGLILTSIMCKAMNRSLANVAFGGMGTEASATEDGDDIYAGKIKSTSAEEVALMLDGVSRVVFVPGYGMAVAQAQHAVRDLTNLLEAEGTTVEFAIHPVAGRMPGHMNVLLAEADIDYDKLKELDESNANFGQTDVTFVIGANDVVNPVAREPGSAIAGMPILDVDKSRNVVVIKRSLSPGFAGIPNPLFCADNSLMLFADAKKAMLDIVAAMKENA